MIICLGVAINFIQTYRSQQAIEKLRENVTPTATVLRDGNVAGNQATRNRARRSGAALRRRSRPRGRQADRSARSLRPAIRADRRIDAGRKRSRSSATGNPSTGPDALNLVFLGTSVVSGTGTAEILKTGAQTIFGAIAERLVMRPEETDFERSMKQFGLLITRTVFFLVLFILVVRVAMHRPAFESFVFAVALAVGLTPEFLPMISSVTLARGAVRMARKQVVVKHLPAIQNFGTIDMLCSDKTGTLTTGQMTLDSSVDYLGKPSDRPLALAYINSKFETGIRSPLDVAILKIDRPDAEAYVKRDEIPFDFDRRRLSVVIEKKNDSAAKHLLITKGAPEGILAVCNSYETDGRVIPLDPDALHRCRKTFDDLSSQGFRLLAAAYREIEPRERYTKDDENSLVLAGYLAFADPPSPDAAASLAALERDGVTVKILTGDNELVARHVCEQVGLANPTIILGDDLEHTTDTALAASGRRSDGLRARFADAEAPHHSRAETARPCGRLHGRWNQRRAVAACGRRGNFGLVRRGRGARGRRHHSARAGPRMCFTTASSKAVGHRPTC